MVRLDIDIENFLIITIGLHVGSRRRLRVGHRITRGSSWMRQARGHLRQHLWVKLPRLRLSTSIGVHRWASILPLRWSVHHLLRLPGGTSLRRLTLHAWLRRVGLDASTSLQNGLTLMHGIAWRWLLRKLAIGWHLLHHHLLWHWLSSL